MFQTRLRELREAAGYKSQQAFADAFGVAQSTVGGWEAGKREPNYTTTIRLAQFFGVSVDFLINEEKYSGLSDKPLTFLNKNGWPEDISEDYRNARTDEMRIKILVNCGYDKAHTYAAHRYFPWQFNGEKSDLSMNEQSDLAFLGDEWPDSYTDEYNSLNTDKRRRLFFLNNGYDKVHEPDARRLCPECFPSVPAEKEELLLGIYRAFNEEGREMMLEHAKYLESTGKYKKDNFNKLGKTQGA